MKKIIAFAAAIMTVVSTAAVTAFADAAPVTIKVSISDKDGKNVLAWEDVEVTDIDSDGQLTINDALYATHEEFYDGGAEEGYATSETEYGLSLKKLWGTENGGSYGYYLNHSMAWSLEDKVSEGDILYAFVYTDLKKWSDSYSFFDCYEAEVETGTKFDGQLKRIVFDEQYMPSETPTEGATITVDGEKTDVVTDAEGKYELTFTDAGVHILSAVSDDYVLVPPVVVVTVKGSDDSSETDPSSVITPDSSEAQPETDSSVPSIDGSSNTDSSSSSKAAAGTNNTAGTTKSTTPAGGGSDNTAKAENAGTGSSSLGLMLAGVAALSAAAVVSKKKNGR